MWIKLLGECRTALNLGNTDLAIDALIRIANSLFKNRTEVSYEQVMEDLAEIEKRNVSRLKPSEAVTGLIRLMLWKKFSDRDSGEYLYRHYHAEVVYRPEVIIVAGKGSSLSRKQKEVWTPFLCQVLSGFEGTVISGGTDSGIPGLTGEITEEWTINNMKRWYLLGYLPGKLFSGTGHSPGYDHFITSPTDDFSLVDVLNYWVDILFRGIPSETILLAGINGGPLSLFEYQLALAMGARVALLKYSGGSVEKILKDPLWSHQPNLLITHGEIHVQ